MSTLNLAAASKALADLASERARLEASIEKNARTRETLAASRLPKEDIQALFLTRIESIAKSAPELLERSIEQVATRPGKLWQGPHGVPFLPDDAGTLARFICAMLPKELSIGVQRAFSLMPEHPDAGPPLSERASRIAALDKALDADHKALSSLRDAALAAGLAWPDRGMF